MHIEDRVIAMTTSWVDDYILMPALQFLSRFVEWNNYDPIRWAWTFLGIWIIGLLTVITIQAWFSRGIRINKRKSITTNLTVIGIKNDTDFDLKNCYVQVVDVEPRLALPQGIYNRLPSKLMWEGMKDSAVVEAGAEHELIIGSDNYIYLGAPGIVKPHYKLEPNIEFECELLFRGVGAEEKITKKLFGIKVISSGENLFINKIME
jgi:hypothetical protein